MYIFDVDKIQNSLTKCECFLEIYQKLFVHKGPVGRSNEVRVKRKKSHSKRRAQKRKLKLLCKQCQYLVNELSPDVKTVPEEFVFKQSMKSVNDIYNLKEISKQIVLTLTMSQVLVSNT